MEGWTDTTVSLQGIELEEKELNLIFTNLTCVLQPLQLLHIYKAIFDKCTRKINDSLDK